MSYDETRWNDAAIARYRTFNEQHIFIDGCSYEASHWRAKLEAAESTIASLRNSYSKLEDDWRARISDKEYAEHMEGQMRSAVYEETARAEAAERELTIVRDELWATRLSKEAAERWRTEYNDLREWTNAAERERDELRTDNCKLALDAKHMGEHLQEMAARCDELRAEVERLRFRWNDVLALNNRIEEMCELTPERPEVTAAAEEAERILRKVPRREHGDFERELLLTELSAGEEQGE